MRRVAASHHVADMDGAPRLLRLFILKLLPFQSRPDLHQSRSGLEVLTCGTMYRAEYLRQPRGEREFARTCVLARPRGHSSAIVKDKSAAAALITSSIAASYSLSRPVCPPCLRISLSCRVEQGRHSSKTAAAIWRTCKQAPGNRDEYPRATSPFKMLPWCGKVRCSSSWRRDNIASVQVTVASAFCAVGRAHGGIR